MKTTSQGETRIVFTITGEALTRITRGFMTDDWPDKAFTFLMEGLPGIDVASAQGVLEGRLRLTGDSAQGVRVEPDDSASAQEHAEHIVFLYAGRVRVKGRWWRPRAMVTQFCSRDVPRGSDTPLNLPIAEHARAFAAWHSARVGFYAASDEIVLETTRTGHDRFVVFTPCGAPPVWFKQEIDATRALDAFEAAGRELEEIRGSDTGEP